MLARVAINGFGRIGRLSLRALLEYHQGRASVVAVNNPTGLETAAHLFKYDSSYGTYPGKVEVGEGLLRVDDTDITVLREMDPSRLPWKKLGVDFVIESTGVFTDGRAVAGHLDAGAQRVLITAPATNEDLTVVLGVNDHAYDPKKHRKSRRHCTRHRTR